MKMVGLLSECWGQTPIHYLRLWYLGYAGRAVPVSLWDSGDLGFVTVSVAAFVTAITQQEQVLIIALPAHLTVLQNQRATIILINGVGKIRILGYFFWICYSPLSWWTSPRRWTSVTAGCTWPTGQHCALHSGPSSTPSCRGPPPPRHWEKRMWKDGDEKKRQNTHTCQYWG